MDRNEKDSISIWIVLILEVQMNDVYIPNPEQPKSQPKQKYIDSIEIFTQLTGNTCREL